tara:strand:- start:183 stop:929 length:747 start_codon:yes stop_codon:yes gene_type:complete
MQKTKQVANTVYMTNDYSIFQKMEHNRTVYEAHVHRLMKSMSEKQYAVPIVVNEKNEIADGQNRFEAIKNLKLPVYYIVINGLTIEDVKRLNKDNKTWSEIDYAESFKSEGYGAYKKYLIFRREYGFGHSISLTILADHTSDQKFMSQMFYDGALEVKDFELARENAMRLRACREYYDGWKHRAFVYAMLKLFKAPNFNYKRFMSKLSQKPVELIRNLRLIRNIVDANRAIEDIYNYKCSDAKRVRLY